MQTIHIEIIHKNKIFENLDWIDQIKLWILQLKKVSESIKIMQSLMSYKGIFLKKYPEIQSSQCFRATSKSVNSREDINRMLTRDA
jgi:hypothetical protein